MYCLCTGDSKHTEHKNLLRVL